MDFTCAKILCWHRRSQGVHLVHVHPPERRKKIGGPNLQGKVVSAPHAESAPPRKSKSLIFGGNWGDNGRWERSCKQF